MGITRLLRGFALAALVFVAAVSSVKADSLAENTATSSATDANFINVLYDGSQTITMGGASVQGCGSSGKTTPCTSVGTLDIDYSGSTPTALIVNSPKFYIDITGSLLTSIFGGTGLAPTAIGTIGHQYNFTALQSCFWQFGAVGPATSSSCTGAGQSGYITEYANDTFVASFGSVGVAFTLTPTPEPASFDLLLMGLGGLGFVRRKSFFKKS